MKLDEKSRASAIEDSEGRDLIRLYEAVAERCLSQDPEDYKREFLTILLDLIAIGQLTVRLAPNLTSRVSDLPGSPSEIVDCLERNWPKHISSDPYDVEMLVFIESNCLIWWSSWGPANEEFKRSAFR